MITWDEPKRLANLDKHGLDFADLTLAFFASAIIMPARNPRFKAIGPFESDVIVLIFAPLGSEALSIISMRPAGHAERTMLE